MIETLTHTRAALLIRRSQLRIAQDGISMLEGKRKALLAELLRQAKQYRELLWELHKKYNAARIALILARATRGSPEIEAVAHALERKINVDVQFHKIWGLPLATIKAQNIIRNRKEWCLGQFASSSHIWESVETAEEFLETLLRCAPMERNLRLLADEIKKISRRINSIREFLIPQIQTEIQSIIQALEEREREETFRLKLTKKKKHFELQRGSEHCY